MKRKIIIVGYPKSGNTWLTRLTAELVGCPVAGFLYAYRQDEIAVEGQERESPYVVYKSHHQLSELTAEDRSNADIIYVIRDPRDVYLSGINYFKLRFFRRVNWSKLGKLAPVFRDADGLINSLYHRINVKRAVRRAVLYGDERVNRWCRTSWGEHVHPYLATENVLKVRYEDLLNEPEAVSASILQFLDLPPTPSHITKAVERQSFARVRNKFTAAGETEKAAFLRRGEAEQWREGMPGKHRARFQKVFGDLLERLRYPAGV